MYDVHLLRSPQNHLVLFNRMAYFYYYSNQIKTKTQIMADHIHKQILMKQIKIYLDCRHAPKPPVHPFYKIN